MSKLVGLFSVFLLGFYCAFSANAQLSDAAAWASTVQNDFRVISDITYRQANGVELKIDVYNPVMMKGLLPPSFIIMAAAGWAAIKKPMFFASYPIWNRAGRLLMCNTA